MKHAPFHAEVAEGPDGALAYWLTARDGVRLRAVFWPCNGAKATVLIFPGRTEVVEKYGRVAGWLANAGYACAAIDWRGQGLSDRLLADPMIGHVGRFSDYQLDAEAYVEAAETAPADVLPKPFFLIGHSMGGAIGLRAVLKGLDVAAAAFSAPMWGLSMPGWQKPAAEVLTRILPALGLGEIRAPGTNPASYLATAPFTGNSLTTSADGWDYMRAQVLAEPQFQLGGPSIQWLREAMAECASLATAFPRNVPLIAGMGSAESIVDPQAVEARMANWPGSRMLRIDGAQHELMMETEARRSAFFGPTLRLFDRHCTAPNPQ